LAEELFCKRSNETAIQIFLVEGPPYIQLITNFDGYDYIHFCIFV